MAANRFDQPYRPIKFRDAQSTFVPEEFIDTNINEAYVPLPLEGIEKQYTGLQSKFDESQKNIAATSQKIKDYGLEQVNLWGQDVPVSHRQKVTQRNDQYRAAIKDLSDEVAAGDMNALNKIDTLAANYVNDPYLTYAREAEERDKAYAAEIQKAKLAGDEHRANQIYLERLALAQDPNQEAPIGGNAIVEDAVDRSGKINKIFEGIKADGSANARGVFSITGEDLGFLKTSRESVDPRDVGVIFTLGVARDPQLMNDIQQEGLAQAYKLSLQDPKNLEKDEAVLNDKGEVDIVKTANKYANETFSDLRNAEMVKRGYTVTDESVSNHDWFYKQNKGKADKEEEKPMLIGSEGPIEGTNLDIVDDKGNLKITDARNKVVSSKVRLSQIDEQLKNPNLSTNVRNTLEAEKKGIESNSGFANQLVTESHARVTPNELADEIQSSFDIAGDPETFLENTRNAAKAFLGLDIGDNTGNILTDKPVYKTIKSINNPKGRDFIGTTLTTQEAHKFANVQSMEEYASLVKEFATKYNWDQHKREGGFFGLGPATDIEVGTGQDLLAGISKAVNGLDKLAQPHIQTLYNNAASTHNVSVIPTKESEPQTKLIEAQLATINKSGWVGVPVRGQKESDVDLYGNNGLIKQGYTVNIPKSKGSVLFSNDWKKAGHQVVMSKEGEDDKVVMVYPLNEDDAQNYAATLARLNEGNTNDQNELSRRVPNAQLWANQFENFPEVGVPKTINYSFKTGVTSPIAKLERVDSPVNGESGYLNSDVNNRTGFKIFWPSGKQYMTNSGISVFTRDQAMDFLTAVKDQIEK
jgi:hypothetical protein